MAPGWQVAFGALCALAVLAIPVRPADAQQPGYDNYRVGDRALGLAGAFVGLADDASAAYHNPAGLAPLEGGSLSTSLWAEALQLDKVTGGYSTDLGDSELGHSNFVGLPFFLAATIKLGPRNADGRARNALGLTLVSPYSSASEYQVQQEGTSVSTGFDAATKFSTEIDEGAKWIGLSYAYLASKRISLGLTAFGTLRSTDIREHNTRVERGDLATQEPSSTRSSDFDLSAHSYNLLMRVGLLWDMSRNFRLGLMLQPPGPALSSSATYNLLELRTDPATTSSDFRALTDGQADFSFTMPWEARSGLTWFYDDTTLLTLDVSLVGPARMISSVADALEPLVGRPLPGLLFERSVTLRGGLGGELMSFGLPLRGGLLFDVSPAAAPDNVGVHLRTPMTVGGSLSVGILGEGYGIAVGVTVTHATGVTGLLRFDPELAEAVFDAAETRRTTIALFVSGGSRVARKLADSLKETFDEEPDAGQP